ncbi:helix-turn-helix transcriptional regulator [Pelagibius sp. Alg239-R121]|uniref:helix-turn-helix domain-containing protein n=1 Tax=Pelagibius sp. Alg239-R121 TaxID=2993448 RepID=UPI0024A6C798|nr:helix-turn-helix transcriptional regulator [Pelagibius sp. Alg239-R121]
MISSEQIRGARGMVGWSSRELAEKAGLGLATIQRMENRGTGASTAANVEAVTRALAAAGIEFIAENGGGAGVRFKERAGE